MVSRRTPTDVFNDKGTGGTLMLVDAAGASERSLPRYMSDDEHRAFMPSGGTIVFDGRASAGAKPSLYTVATGGTGLRRLSIDGAEPAPCANGTIVFVRNGDLYLLSRSRRSAKRTGLFA